MIGIYSILLGAVIVASALFLLRREFRRAYFIGGLPKANDEGQPLDEGLVLGALNDVEEAMKEMSEAFYDITGDLEGHYSVHDKELQLLTERVMALEDLLEGKGKELNAYKKSLDKMHKTMEKTNKRIDSKEFIDPRTQEKQPAEVFEEVKEAVVKQVVIEEENTPVELVSNEGDVKSKIIALRSQGYSLKQIAKTLDIGLGEIQLILNMKRE